MHKLRKNYAGMKYGRFTATEYVKAEGHAAIWKFRCDCGNEVVRRIDHVVRSQNPSCGCYVEDYLEMIRKRSIEEAPERLEAKRIKKEERRKQREEEKHQKLMQTKLYRNITLEKHGSLLVIEKVNDKVGPDAEYKCLCECGNVIIKTQKYITDTTNMRSCGCTRKYKLPEIVREHERIAEIHRGMLDRCYNPECQAYKYYGARGIEVCKSWRDRNDGLINFIKWSMKHGYQDDLTIDRMNVDGNYTPSNCRWADIETQANNKRNTIRIWYEGKEMGLAQFARLKNINYEVASRLTKRCMLSGDYLLTMIDQQPNA